MSKKIKLVLFDVDGVLTDGTLYFDANGEIIKAFHVHDGIAISLLKFHGIQCGVLSGKTSSALETRLSQLKFDISITGRADKLRAYEEMKLEMGFLDEEIAFIGDDVIDLPVLDVVEMSYAPSNAHKLVLQKARYVLNSKGGKGAARELAEHLLMMRGMSLNEMYQPLLSQAANVAVTQ